MPSARSRSSTPRRGSSKKPPKSNKKTGKGEESIRVMSYNLRGYFDRYHARRGLIKDLLRSVSPDVLACQECMVNGAGMDVEMSENLGSSMKHFSDPGIITSLKTKGSKGTEYNPIVATIFVGILQILEFLLKVPVLGTIVGSMPLFMETWRERIGSVTGIDIFNLYYVTLGAFFGLSTIVDVRKFKVSSFESLVLQPKGNRKHLGTATRVLMRSSTGEALFWFVNIHYVHFTTEEGRRMREEECKRVLKWMDSCQSETDRCIIVGDHNTLMSREGIFTAMKDAGYDSAHKLVHGKEPKKTWPTGLKSIYMDTDGFELPEVKKNGGICLDFIFVKGTGIKVKDAGVIGDEADKVDKTLFPSDHAAVWADIVVS